MAVVRAVALTAVSVLKKTMHESVSAYSEALDSIVVSR